VRRHARYSPWVSTVAYVVVLLGTGKFSLILFAEHGIGFILLVFRLTIIVLYTLHIVLSPASLHGYVEKLHLASCRRAIEFPFRSYLGLGVSSSCWSSFDLVVSSVVFIDSTPPEFQPVNCPLRPRPFTDASSDGDPT
jgi:hypothetical protein